MGQFYSGWRRGAGEDQRALSQVYLFWGTPGCRQSCPDERGEEAVSDWGQSVAVLPGDNARISSNLDKSVALDTGSHFAIREGGKTVNSGVITEVCE